MNSKTMILRLRASVAHDAINGDRFERQVCAKQMTDAATLLEKQDAITTNLELILDRIAVERQCSLDQLLDAYKK